MINTISVIIPTYNRSNKIVRAIQSVLDQTYQNFEIFIVDDASTDDTEKIVTSLKDARIHYYKMKLNKGGGAARNKGIELSKGNFVSFLDSDDEWKVNMLESCIAQLNSLNNKNVIIFSKLVMDNKIDRKIFPKNVYKGGSISEYIFCQEGLVSTITLFMPREIANKIMFNAKLRIHQDYDFVLRAYKNGVSFSMIDDVLAIWHNEIRSDRMGNTKNYLFSYKWMQDNKELFTEKSLRGFVSRDVVSIVCRNKFSLKALKFLLNLLKEELITNKQFYKSILRLILINPRKLIKRLKAN